MTASKSAADRVAALRDEYARSDEDVTGLSDTELLLQQLDQANAESRRHANDHSSLLQDQTKHERAIRAAARRGGQENRADYARIYLGAILRKEAAPVNAIIYRIEQLPDEGKPTLDQIRGLKTAAKHAKRLLEGDVGNPETIAEAKRDGRVQFTEQLIGEVQRLRDFINAQGRRLHAEYGNSGTRESGWRCECPGCELMRAMDDVPAEQAA